MSSAAFRPFPSPERADPWGVVCWDGPLTPPRLLAAYRQGIFPWPDRIEGRWHTAWASPDPRAILPLEGLHVPRRLERKARGERFRCTWNQRFHDVVMACATVGNRRGATWISPALQQAVAHLHLQGFAHSIEVWDTCDPQAEERPCGGLYGIAIGGLFAAESMFHVTSDASKLAILELVQRLRECGFVLLDVQQATPHLIRWGAIELSRREYLARLAHAMEVQPLPLPSTSLEQTPGSDQDG